MVISISVVASSGNWYPSGTSISVISYFPTSSSTFIFPWLFVVYVDVEIFSSPVFSSFGVIVNFTPSNGVVPSSEYLFNSNSLFAFL